MKLREIIREFFSRLFNRGSKKGQPTGETPTSKGKGVGVVKSGSSTYSNANGHSSGKDVPTAQQTQEITSKPIKDSQTDKNPQPKVSKTYTVQTIPFLTSKLDLDYEAIYKVSYSIHDSDEAKFPIIRAPKIGCVIKLPVIGRSGKRGFCEQKLCDKIKDLKLQGFYDNFSLFVGNNSNPYEPDLAYIDAQKRIFIDIEIDEPYSGWERQPIHYKIRNGITVDDARNNYFTERGWTVLRFSEKQVHEQPKSCLKRVYQLLNEMDGAITMPQCLATEADISSNDMWTKEQAERMEQNKEREKMLGIDKFIQTVEGTHSPLKDYSKGRELEKNIFQRKKETGPKVVTVINSTYTPPQRPMAPISNTDDQRQREAEQYEHPQRIATQSKPKTTPSSRGYA